MAPTPSQEIHSVYLGSDAKDPPIVQYRDPLKYPEFRLWLQDHAGFCRVCKAPHSLISHWENCPAFTGMHGHKWTRLGNT